VLTGKGYYIWQIPRCEAGNASAIANVAVQAGLSHVLIKIADGEVAYNVNSTTKVDLVPPVLSALRERNIQVWGWHYVYGYSPLGEADIAIKRIKELGVDGYVIDAEAQYTEPGRDAVARQFMSRLRSSLPTFPIALSSYRYPTLHPNLPWLAFLEKCDLNMPQVYWIGAHNPADQLSRCLREFQGLAIFRPIIPTGAAFVQSGWQPTTTEVTDFLTAAQNLNMTAANFWEWSNTRLYLPEIWNAIAAFPWPPTPNNQDIPARYIAALNTHDPEQVIALYQPNAVHVTAKRSIQGVDAIRGWYLSLFSQILPNAQFTLGTQTGQLGSRNFSWTATSSAGNVNNGYDAIGLVNQKIVYHYTSFKVT
jgi:hypothetical protein